MSQPRHHSLIEQLVNQAIGYAIAYGMNRYLLPLVFGLSIDASKAHGMTIMFTVVSIIRGYGCRRLFNWIHVRQSKRAE